ncbi:DnaD domain protein [Sporosarcina gallistercoris]|uniref:DnaD domain protein n=1 Tax=Sporosarcina gallistercoris TaxID=2762245 RepID=UPI003D28402F
MIEKEGALIDYIEGTEPIDMLEEIGGRIPSPEDIKLIERLETAHGLSKPVINVLLQYVILSDNGIVNQTRILRLASHLVLQPIKTAEQALRFFKDQHALKKKWEEEKLTRQGGRELSFFTSDETYKKFTEVLQQKGCSNEDTGFQSLVNEAYKEVMEIK